MLSGKIESKNQVKQTICLAHKSRSHQRERW